MGIVDHDQLTKDIGPAVPYGARFGRFSAKYEIPEGAVVMSKREMQDLVQRTVTKWKPKDEMWSFRHGQGILGGAAALSGIFLNNEMRSRFKLRNIGPFLTFGPTCVIPVITTVMVQQIAVTHKLFLNEFDCPSCAQIRSGSLMVATGFFQPLLLSMLTCNIIANYKYTIKLPRLNDPKIWSSFAKMLRPNQLPMLGLILLNFGVGVFITEHQQRALVKVHRRLNEGY